MKKYILLVVLLAATKAWSLSAGIYNKLVEVNPYWKQHYTTDLFFAEAPALLRNEHEMIRTHLMLVENILRKTNTSHLTAAQKTARSNSLNDLHRYWMAGNFPVNNKLSSRNPVFIDDYNNFCAVGYLVKASGHESISRQIAASQNLCYLKDIRNASLTRWISLSGFTADELAWIQPGYVAGTLTKNVGQGVDGKVNVLLSDEAGDIIYAAGKFSSPQKNIVKINLSDNTPEFTAMGGGFNDEVNTLIIFNNTLFAGGSFTASGTEEMAGIARWNGSAWIKSGSLDGTVKTMCVYNNELYAGGNFTFTSGNTVYSSLAKWDGQEWLPVTSAITGTVNALCVFNGQLVAGGDFNAVAGNPSCRNIFSYNGTAVTSLENGTPLPVKCLYAAAGILYAGGDVLSANKSDTFGIAEFSAGGTWINQYKTMLAERTNAPAVAATSVHTIYGYEGKILVGGLLTGTDILYYSANSAVYNNGLLEPLSDFNGEVTAFTAHHDRLFYGGAFTELQYGNGNGSASKLKANGIAMKGKGFTGINSARPAENSFVIYPNPASGYFHVSGTAFDHILVHGLDGKEAARFSAGTDEAIRHDLAPGIYFVSVISGDNCLERKKLVIK